MTQVTNVSTEVQDTTEVQLQSQQVPAANIQAQPAQAEPQQQATTPAPEVDEAAIAKKVADDVKGAIADQVQSEIKNAFRAASGESDKKEPHEIHSYFAKDPSAFTNDVIDIAKEEIIKEQKAAAAVTREQKAAMQKMTQRCPSVADAKYHNDIQANYDALKASDSNLSEAELVEKSFNATIERFGLQTLSDEEMERGMALPTAGGGNYPVGNPQSDPNKSNQDFIQSLKDQASSFRVKKV